MDDFNAGTKTDTVISRPFVPNGMRLLPPAPFTRKSRPTVAEFTYLNASIPQGTAYFDKVFAALNKEFAKPLSERTDLDPWTGFLY